MFERLWVKGRRIETYRFTPMFELLLGYTSSDKETLVGLGEQNSNRVAEFGWRPFTL